MPGKRGSSSSCGTRNRWSAEAIAEQVNRVGQEQGCPVETLDALGER